MIGYYTDNGVSKAVMRAFAHGGLQVSHIKDFDPFNCSESFFYGILRGTGIAMRHLQFMNEPFWYSDNGYFDAVYMDERKRKDMSGKYRIVKNDMIEPINAKPIKVASGPMNIMLLPPSVYTAFMYDTLPEEWLATWHKKLTDLGHSVHVRDKDDNRPFDKAVSDFDAVFAFNSIAVVKAIEMGKAVYTTHGIIRNAEVIDKFAPYYDIEEIYKFYEPKQFTLEEIKDRGVECLI